MATGNPFNNLVFNEVRPTYVEPPIEEVASAREYITETGRANQDAYTILNNKYAETASQIGPDPEGIAILNQHKEDLTNNIQGMLDRQDFAYMGPALRDQASKFLGDTRLANRKVAYSDYKAKKDNILANPEIDEKAKELLIPEYRYQGNDETGQLALTDVRKPVERVNLSDAMLKGYKAMKANGVINEGDWFKKIGGGYTRDLNEAVSTDIYTQVNGTKVLDRGRIQEVMKEVLKNDPKALQYIVQDEVVRNGDQIPDANTAFNIIDNITNDPEQLDTLLNKRSAELAGNLEYSEITNSNRISPTRQGRGASPSTGTPNDEIFTNMNTKLGTKYNTVEDVSEGINQVEQSTTNTFDAAGIEYTDITEREAYLKTASTGGYETIEENNPQLTPASVVQTTNELRRNNIKLHAAKEYETEVLEDFKDKNESMYNHMQMKNPDDEEALNSLRELASKHYGGIENVPGVTMTDKASNILKGIYSAVELENLKHTIDNATGIIQIPRYIPKVNSINLDKEDLENRSKLLEHNKAWHTLWNNYKTRTGLKEINEIIENKSNKVSNVITTNSLPINNLTKDKLNIEALEGNIFNGGNLFSYELYDRQTGEKLTPEEKEDLLGKQGRNTVSKYKGSTVNITTTTIDGVPMLSFSATITDEDNNEINRNLAIKASKDVGVTSESLEDMKSSPKYQAVSDYNTLGILDDTTFPAPYNGTITAIIDGTLHRSPRIYTTTTSNGNKVTYVDNKIATEKEVIKAMEIANALLLHKQNMYIESKQ